MTAVDLAELISGFLFEQPQIEHVSISDHLISAIAKDKTFSIVVRSKDRQAEEGQGWNPGEPASCKKPDSPDPSGKNSSDGAGPLAGQEEP